MQIQIVARPIQKVIPRGFFLERREYISPKALIKKVSDYQYAGGYVLEVLNWNESVAKLVLTSYDDSTCSKFIGDLLITCHNAFTFDIKTL